jgi:hypothetical protein
MDAYKINVKFFIRDSAGIKQEEFVPVFHSWIQNQSIAEHTLIDVADYAHVQDGPGTVLVAHEANFYADRVGGRLGFTYSRKQPVAGDFAQRLRQAIAAALEGCSLLESDPRLEGRISFVTDEFMIQLNDRLHAPNTDETLAQIEPAVKRVVSNIYGNDARLERRGAERELFEVRVHAGSAPTITELLFRASAAAAGGASGPSR